MTRVELDFGQLLPDVRVPPPGPVSRALMQRLGVVESRNITHQSDRWPVFWDEAAGANVRDVDGNVYIDLTSAFGVGLMGHGSVRVREAISDQSGRLIHGMGDIHPPAKKLELLERLAGIAPWPDTKTVLATTGSEALEVGLKTARLASGRPGVLAFEGGYHGLTLGSLAATERPHFRAPFEERVYGGVAFAPFPDPLRDEDEHGDAALERVEDLLRSGAPGGDAIGTVVVEPVQARGGARVPPDGFMEKLSELAHRHGAVIVADEVMTGLGRCGAVLASDLVGLTPDIVCIGKALGGGLPISACMAPKEVMDAWPPSEGEAIHTSTFLGHPLSCAAALAVLDAVESGEIPTRADELGGSLLEGLTSLLAPLPHVAAVRGLGLLLGIELVRGDGRTPAAGAAVRAAEDALTEGVLVLPAGDDGHVLELTPPVVLTKGQREHAIRVLGSVIEKVDV